MSKNELSTDGLANNPEYQGLIDVARGGDLEAKEKIREIVANHLLEVSPESNLTLDLEKIKDDQEAIEQYLENRENNYDKLE